MHFGGKGSVKSGHYFSIIFRLPLWRFGAPVRRPSIDPILLSIMYVGLYACWNVLARIMVDKTPATYTYTHTLVVV